MCDGRMLQWWPVAGPAGPVSCPRKSQRAGSDHFVEDKERFEQEVVAPDELVGGGEPVPLLVAAVAEAAVGSEVAGCQGVDDVLGGCAVLVAAGRGQLQQRGGGDGRG